ncbi:type II secretion system protein M [Psychrosphaera ytuae]|uniref:Type II secretion system protein M n=1 Tax=Psychrosphaera ytuae TaxID=2820710 RepID=A0A975DBC7_9GAMM|nr:type II secretion system protein GspM [Psychrosphaera ytuae]QTH63176.1 type II secretion system protein M [Psychrosphaera ytuae]
MSKWQEFSEKFIALTQREKIIVAFTCVFLVTYGLYFLLLEPSLKQQKNLNNRIVSANQQVSDLQQQISIIQAALREDPNKEIKAQISQLKTALKDTDGQLEAAMSQYVAPEEMARKLTQLLQTAPGLRVTSLVVHKPSQLDPNAINDAGNTDETDNNMADESAEIIQQEPVGQTKLPMLYRHKMTLAVKGGYFDLMSFVKRVLENNKQFTVNDLDYEVGTHPEATLTLSLVTISDNENVIRL